jgi:hypothetical protein
VVVEVGAAVVVDAVSWWVFGWWDGVAGLLAEVNGWYVVIELGIDC